MNENNASSRDSHRGRGRFGLGLAVGALAGFIVARRLSAPQRMPHLTVWQRALAEKRGEAEAAGLVARAQIRYDELQARRPRPASRALRFHLHRILAGLALYQTLIEESDDRQTVLAEMKYLITSAQTGLALGAWLQARMPFPVRRRVLPWVMRFGFPAEGWDWDLEPLQDSEGCFAYNIRRCFILDTLRSYGAPELTPAYCGLDDAMAAKLPPSITWERTMTLGWGHDRCDFRWCRAAPEVAVSGARER